MNNTDTSPENLLKVLVERFSQNEEVFLVGTFGSAVNEMDQYSDVDIIVCSNDMATTYGHYRKTIESISEISAVSPFYDERPNVISEVIYLKGYSPYQKIDLTIVPYLGYLSDFNPNIFIMYENQTVDRTLKRGIVHKSRPIETLDSWLIKYMGFVVGFVKSYKRGAMELYRYWDFVKDSMIVLLLEKYVGWNRAYDKLRLDSPEYKDLFYRKINKNEYDLLSQVLPQSGVLDIKRSFIVAFFLLTELLTMKSNDLKEYVNLQFIEDMKNFVQAELK